ncbi:dephospho-CoA kinase [Dysgonomonas sp. Marseille-P4361]|uniref:dephospho-CoA kinase n=1 Tax=Dysgonomonas sp. Marseille-P4361 TaxID=2161820 RepID=UPI000D55C1AE|nr:dephospho-CoA kinase [Dysgonomonas sp. Marseille-P4361]
MIKLGITGGIGSGKSTVSELFTLLDIPVYIADKESKRLTETSVVIKEQLIALFGEDLYQDGILNKALLASYIFSDKEKLEKVNRIIHPVVGNDFNEWIELNKTSEIVAQEAAILFESGFDKLVDKVVVVYTPLEMRISRTMQRDGVSREKVLERIENQMSDEKKVELSDFVIVNDGMLSLIEQVLEIINKLKELAKE